MKIILLVVVAASMAGAAAARDLATIATAPFGGGDLLFRQLSVDFSLKHQGIPQPPMSITALAHVSYEGSVHGQRSLSWLDTDLVRLLTSPAISETRLLEAFNESSGEHDAYRITFRLENDPLPDRFAVDGQSSIGVFMDVLGLVDQVTNEGILYDQIVSRSVGSWIAIPDAPSTWESFGRVRPTRTTRNYNQWAVGGIETQTPITTGGFDTTLTRDLLEVAFEVSYLPIDEDILVGALRWRGSDASNAAAVPEPCSLSILLIAVAWSLCRGVSKP